MSVGDKYYNGTIRVSKLPDLFHIESIFNILTPDYAAFVTLSEQYGKI